MPIKAIELKMTLQPIVLEAYRTLVAGVFCVLKTVK